MKHLIMVRSEMGTEEIAKFKNEFDRDVCLDTLREEFPDPDIEFFAATGS